MSHWRGVCSSPRLNKVLELTQGLLVEVQEAAEYLWYRFVEEPGTKSSINAYVWTKG